MKRLVTMTGKFGDILWSLPTVRALAKRDACFVDMAIMSPYRSILTLLRQQIYIGDAYVLEDWCPLHSNFGDQPWLPPTLPEGYEEYTHLGYRSHPDRPLAAFTAIQQGIELDKEDFPFLHVDNKEVDSNLIVMGFNQNFTTEVNIFWNRLRDLTPGKTYIDLNSVRWEDLANRISSASCFVGCRSSLAVAAYGVGLTPTIIFEPEAARHAAWFAPPNAAEEIIVGNADDAARIILGTS